MHKLKNLTISIILVMALVLAGQSFDVSASPLAQTTPPMGQAGSFAILASTYTNTVGGTTINGDLGYTTPPAVAPTVNGNTHIANGTYNQAGIDQGSALANLNGQPCTFSFAPGAIDLATDVTNPNGAGNFTPGVWCITGAADIGGGGTITLTGAGTYIFRMSGALNTSANSIVTLAGADPCDVFWTPGGATTLGANSTFVGTDIDDSGITIGSTITWTGRALAFASTVSTTTDTINVPTCAAGGEEEEDTSVNRLPNTGAAPIRSEDFPWSVVIVGVISAIALALGVRAYRRTHLPKH